jgi:type II secretory pathway pseudopilin PulG
MARLTGGFSTVEVLVALIVLSVGLLGTLATAAVTTRLIAEARARDRATLIAAARLESERAIAAAVGGCAALAGGTRSLPGRIQEGWSMTGVGPLRQLEVIVTLPTHRGFRSDTVRTVLRCG